MGKTQLQPSPLLSIQSKLKPASNKISITSPKPNSPPSNTPSILIQTARETTTWVSEYKTLNNLSLLALLPAVK